MSSKKILLILLLTGAVLFNILFWKESLGINLLLFTIFNIGALLFVNQGKKISTPAKITGACTLLLSVCVIINHSIISIVVYSISFLAMIGFVHQSELQLFFYGLLQSFSNLKLGAFTSGLKEMSTSSGVDTRKVYKYFKLGIVPLFVLLIFYLLYYSANPEFASFSDTAFSWMGKFFTLDISFTRILFFVFGLVITGMVLWKEEFSSFVERNNFLSEQLVRLRRKDNFGVGSPMMLDLKREYQTGILMFLMLNVLLLVVNIFDVNFIWFNFEENPSYNLKTFVHHGTYTLIGSILLAMLLIIYFFRGNLNFYKDNEKLKWLTYAWIAQNGVLAISLAIRNYRYIQFHGLAYKRIGVIIFLIAVMIGLITMYMKVREKRSLYFLINRNTWAVYFLLVLSSCINWDTSITKYNIFANTKRSLEVNVLMYQLSDKNWYLLKKHTDEIAKKTGGRFDPIHFDRSCEWKKNNIINRNNNTTWLSWNYPDYKNLKEIKLYK